MDKLSKTISVKVTPEMEEVIRAIALNEGVTVCDMGRILFAEKIKQVRDQYLENRKSYDSIFGDQLK